MADGNSFDDLGMFGGNLTLAANSQQSEIVCQNNRFNYLGGNAAISGGRGSYVLSDNDFTNAANAAALQAQVLDLSGTATVACRNNVLPNMGQMEISTTGADTCAAISGNTSQTLTVTENGPAEFSIEGLNAPEGGPLNALNSATVVVNGTPTSVPLGSCGI